MDNLEISGKSVEEAIQRALKQLGVTREQVEVIVLKEGRAGILGIGAEEARISVSLIDSAQRTENTTIEMARDALEKLLHQMDITASIVLTGNPGGEEGEGSPITFDVRGDDLGILIGRQGQTLAALQFMVRLIISQQAKSLVPIIIDVEGYKQRHYEALRSLARRIAEQVVMRRTPMALRPMPAYERRVVHLALANYPGVVTESTGMGLARKVVIMPRNNK